MPSRNIEGNYRYGYQGEYAEKEPELGNGQNSFELRLWDARIGRWLTTDPYGEFHSLYLGIGNNPLSRVDPDGGQTDDCCSGAVELDQVNLTGNGGNRLQSEGFNFDIIGWFKNIFTVNPTSKSLNQINSIQDDYSNAHSALNLVKDVSFKHLEYTLEMGTLPFGGPPGKGKAVREITDKTYKEVFTNKRTFQLYKKIIKQLDKAIDATSTKKTVLKEVGKKHFKGTTFRAGKKAARDGILNTLPQKFRDWFHRFYKKNNRGPNLSDDEILEIYEEWVKMGRPGG